MNKIRYTWAFLWFALILPLLGSQLYAQSTASVLSGMVSETEDGVSRPIIGANVALVNNQNRTLIGSLTDANGHYNLPIGQEEEIEEIVISYIGYETKRVKYNGQRNLNVTLISDSDVIEAVSVTGQVVNDMGIGQREMVSATQKVKMSELVMTRPVTSFEEAIQGQLAGVDIVTAGDPGARSSIVIRGVSTLNANAEPLIVIDGVPYNNDVDADFDFSTANEDDLGALLNISPVDIESIEVLKDASATAIWGTKGANGVLLITTKRGSIGKTRFSFSSKYSGKTQPATIPMLNGNQYTALMQEAIWNSVNYLGTTNQTYLNLLFDTPEIGYDQSWRYFDEYNQNTDWIDHVSQTAHTFENNLSMSGGGEKATYRFSVGHMDDDGVTIGTHFKRVSASGNINYQFSNKLRFGADFSYVEGTRDANWASNVRSEAFGKMPNKSPYYIDDATGLMTDQYFNYQSPTWEGAFKSNAAGSNASGYNPVAMVHEASNEEKTRNRRMIVRADYAIMDGLKYSAYASLTMNSAKTQRFLPRVVTGVTMFNENANLSSDNYSESLAIQTENKLTYIKDWHNTHQLVANGVFRTSQSTGSYYESTVSGLASSDVTDPIVSPSVFNIRSGESEGRSFSGIGLLNYSYKNRYVLQGSMSMESSSAMGRNQRLGYFPGAGVSWNIQEEPFMEAARNTWLTEAKIRLSYGQSGRAPKGNSIYLGAFSAGDNYMDMPTIHPIRIQLDNLKWENSTEYNYGLDVGLFKNNVRFTFDYYERYGSDLLQKDVRIPSSTGFPELLYYNSGKIENKGFEFRTDITILQNKDWRVSGSLNLARNVNKITEMPINMSEETGVAEADASLANGQYARRTVIGRPTGAFFGYQYNGVYSTMADTYARDAQGEVMNDVNGQPISMRNGIYPVFAGDAIYEDVNHDGVINKYDMVYLGNSNPTISGGFNLSVRYKQVSLTAMFHGRFGQSVVNMARMENEAMFNKRNQSTAVLRRWRNEGDVTDIPRALYNEGLNYLGSDRFVEDASFLRLKTLSLNYAFSRKFLDRVGINGLGVFVSGYNLLTWTNYSGQDPEVAVKNGLAIDVATTPTTIRFAAGVNLNL